MLLVDEEEAKKERKEKIERGEKKKMSHNWITAATFSQILTTIRP